MRNPITDPQVGDIVDTQYGRREVLMRHQKQGQVTYLENGKRVSTCQITTWVRAAAKGGSVLVYGDTTPPAEQPSTEAAPEVEPKPETPNAWTDTLPKRGDLVMYVSKNGRAFGPYVVIGIRPGSTGMNLKVVALEYDHEAPNKCFPLNGYSWAERFRPARPCEIPVDPSPTPWRVGGDARETTKGRMLEIVDARNGHVGWVLCPNGSDTHLENLNRILKAGGGLPLTFHSREVE